jgi:uncharacterized membrane protein
VLVGAAVGYQLLQRAIVARNGHNSALAAAIGSDYKGWISLIIYIVAVPLAFAHPLIAIALYIVVAMLWFIPDRRIETNMNTKA